MSDYRRLYTPGGIYFFTLVTYKRKPILCENQAMIRLKAAFGYVKKKHPFRIIGLVILPDHLHCILQLPKQDHDFSRRLGLIKHYFSIKMPGEINNRREKNIWQKRFWEHLIRDEDDLERCLDYIHYNPVKHSYIARPYDWPFSTFKSYVKKGYYDPDWSTSVEPNEIQNMDWE